MNSLDMLATWLTETEPTTEDTYKLMGKYDFIRKMYPHDDTSGFDASPVLSKDGFVINIDNDERYWHPFILWCRGKGLKWRKKEFKDLCAELLGDKETVEYNGCEVHQNFLAKNAYRYNIRLAR